MNNPDANQILKQQHNYIKKKTNLLLLPQFLVTLESELDVHHESFTVLKWVFQETGT
jgi:hypothetical protein